MDLSYKLRILEKKKLLRDKVVIIESYKNHLNIENKSFINFTSNDYLGLRSDPRVKKALIKAVNEYGLGSGSSVQISGYYKIHQALEEQFADFLNREQAVFFGSGYLANIGCINALIGRKDEVYLDRFCHASIIDAVLLTRSKYTRYSHNDAQELDFLIQKSKVSNKYIITESVFSMEGDIAKMRQVVEVSKKSKATLIVDDAHGGGILGFKGSGVCELFSLSQDDVPILMNGFGKAFGSYGAIVSGEKDLMELIRQCARTYRYSTALPPIIPSATLEALEIVRNEKWRREKLFENIMYFNGLARKYDLPLISEDLTPIRSLLIPDVNRLIKAKHILSENHMFISIIRSPTVPIGKERIRISLNCFHDKVEILKLLTLIKECYE